MGDLIERLREHFRREIVDWDLLTDAADELARLRAEVACDEQRVNDLMDALHEAERERDELRRRIAAGVVLEMPSRNSLRNEGPHLVLHTAWAEKHGIDGKRVALVVLDAEEAK